MTKLVLFALCFCAAIRASSPEPRIAGTEILWDTYGVPHIFAQNRDGLAYAFGWAQMRNHADLLLRLVAQGRGKASELLGPDYLEEDRWVWTVGMWDAAERSLAAQPADMRAHVASFVAGINAFASRHPELIGDSVRAVLPVRAVDIFAHLHRLQWARFLASPGRARDDTRAWRNRGSNAWAVAPKRSASGRTLLLQNPHLPWADLFTWTEAQYVAPGVNVSGAATVLSPVLQIAFNDNLGWTHTVNTQDGQDLYELTLAGDGYLLDGVVRPFQRSTHVIGVRQRDGSQRPDTVLYRSSVHGPVVAEKPGKVVAMSVVGLHGPALPFALTQWWNMGRARNFAEFMTAIRPNQISGQNITYGDRDGHIMVFYGGNSPVRPVPERAFWSGIVRGDTSATLWTALHGFDDMPKTVDPPSGWVQNANDPPWWATFPAVVRPNDFPGYFATRPMARRPQRSARLLMTDSSITFEEFRQYAFSTRMDVADRLLDDLLPRAKAADDTTTRRAAAILEAWDRTADSSSRGGVLFSTWWDEYLRRLRGRPPYAMPWNENAPLTTPDGLSDTVSAVLALAAASDSVSRKYGSADVAWGVVHRARRDGLDYPMSGGEPDLGIFKVAGFDEHSDGKLAVVGGTSYVAAIEFANPVRAFSLVPYGNASRAGSPHRTDQLALYARKQWKPVLRDRAVIERALSSRERF